MLGLQSGTTPPLVSTGLRLAFDEQSQSHVHAEQPICPVSASLSVDLLAQINQQKDEYEEFLVAQKEQLRRALAERWQRHYRSLLAAAEESAGRRLHDKKAEIESASRRCAELESQLVRLRTESMAWQSKAMAEQATAVSLHAQLQQASAAAASAKGQAIEECCEESPVEDGESAYVDPFRTPGMPERPCLSCRRNPASFVLLPCRHLCLCFACESASAAGERCPACGCFRKGSLQVSLC
ncbi:hypothetical protein HPP92_014648 [Vanilla planifolia]|uniref:RING-type domain-containing protein n=1 Tax=Vanilla planifolia TaxID=51239 RepID=A0A835QGF5_VANPL|nr:hypothetical protein HPP92_014648 [Vanilla planifolia]